MKKRFGFLPLAAALLSLAGCSKIQPVNVAGVVDPGKADYSVYAALGTSITMGYQSGGAVDRHQTRSYPALFARQIGYAPFEQPLVNGDGIAPLSRIVQFGPPLIISNAGRVPGSPTNAALGTAYNNMGVAGAVLPDVVDTTNYNSNQGRAVMFGLVQRGRGSLLAQISTQIYPKPTFVSFEFGSNELLGPVSSGSGTPVIPAGVWAGYLTGVLNALQAALPNAKVAIFNVPDVTTIPLVTTIPPLVLGANGQPVTPYTPLLGPGNVPLVYGQDYVLLTAGPSLAAGQGYPTGTTSYVSGNPVPGTGTGLSDAVVLRASEVASMKAAVDAYNAAIATEAANRGFALADLHGLLLTAKASGFDIGGTKYTSAFLTGGLFSLDGAHPNDLAHGLLCNEMIQSLRNKFHSNLTDVDLASAKTTRADEALPARYDGPILLGQNDAAEALTHLFPWHGAQAP
jgi:hypothetical protein